MDKDTLLSSLKENLTVELETFNPPYSGQYYVKTTIKFNGKKVCSSQATLPSIADLKRSEYPDY